MPMSWVGMDKLSLNKSTHSPIKRNLPQNKHKKLKSGSVAYDIWPGNEEIYSGVGTGVHLHIYLTLYPLTYSPRIHTGQIMNTNIHNKVHIIFGTFTMCWVKGKSDLLTACKTKGYQCKVFWLINTSQNDLPAN